MFSSEIAAPSEKQTELTPDQKFNFAANLSDSAGWTVAMAFFSTTAIAPAFLSKLGASNLLIALVPALVTLGYTMPGIFSANRISGLTYVRRWLFTTAVLERIPLFLIALCAFTVHSPTVLIWCFVGFYFLHSSLLGSNQPAYWVMIAKSIPTLWRGRLFGTAGLIAGVLGIAVLPITNYYLRGQGEALIHGFGYCFLIGAIINFATFLPLGIVREPPSPQHDRAPLPSGARLMAIWRSSSAFRQFIGGQICFATWTIAAPFYLLDGIKNLHVTDSQSGLFAAVGVIFTAFGGSLFGVVSDKQGNKIILIVSAAAALVSSVIAVFVPNADVLAVVFALAALAVAGTGLAGANVTLEFAPTEQDVPHYMTFYNAMLAPVRAGAMLCGGLIAQSSNYSLIFALSAIAAAVSIVFTCRVTEPRHENIGGRLEEPML